MPKRASSEDMIDPVRSRLAAAAAAVQAPVPSAPKPVSIVFSAPAPEDQESTQEPLPEAAGRGRPRPTLDKGRRSSLTINRKILVTRDEAKRIEETAAQISAAFGSRVTYSQVSRAMWSVLAGAEDAINANARRAPNLSAPSKGDHIGMAEYEQALAEFLATALKR